jgi:YihY family inner membrane protein
MSTAATVPETRDLTGDDARRTLRNCGRRKLIRDGFVRLRVADGFSHARSLAYATSLLLVEAIIGVVGLAVALGSGGVSHVIVRTLRAAVPGPGGEFLTHAVTQAHRAGVTHRYGGLVFGVVGALITAATALGQIERAFNRVYGVEQDRPTVRKYGLAAVLALTAGAFACAAFAALALGQNIGTSLHNRAADNAWAVVRWPAAFVLIVVAITLLLRWSPRRRQPRLSWLAFGATVSATLWVIVTVALGLFFSLSTSFGETYGPLAGVVALLLWSFFAAVALLLGAAMTAELEAVRAGVAEPQDKSKATTSEPERVKSLDSARAS